MVCGIRILFQLFIGRAATPNFHTMQHPYEMSITPTTHRLQRQNFATPPMAVMPTAVHHTRSAFRNSHGSSFLDRSHFRGSELSSRLRFDFGLLVDFADPVPVAVVGLRVCVGSISGGEYAIHIGFWGAPSNWKRFRRFMLL